MSRQLFANDICKFIGITGASDDDISDVIFTSNLSRNTVKRHQADREYRQEAVALLAGN